MTGINCHTGQPLEGFDHVIQSLEMIFEIPFGSLPLQRDFGLNWPMILGMRNDVPVVERVEVGLK